MNQIDIEYKKLIKKILEEGSFQDAKSRETRKLSIFSHSMKFNLKEGFPISSIADTDYNKVYNELIQFLSGSNNLKTFLDNDVNVWNDDAHNFYLKKCDKDYEWFRMYNNSGKPYTKKQFIEKIKETPLKECLEKGLGDLGKTYGYQIRQRKLDQLGKLFNGLLNNPHDTGHILNLWSQDDLDEMVLRPCWQYTQFNIRTVDGINYLDTETRYRSNDVVCGTRWNIISSALLTHIFAKVLNFIPGDMSFIIGNAHIYENHIEEAKRFLDIEPEDNSKPVLKFESSLDTTLNNLTSINTEMLVDIFKMMGDKMIIDNYNPKSKINVKMIAPV